MFTHSIFYVKLLKLRKNDSFLECDVTRSHQPSVFYKYGAIITLSSAFRFNGNSGRDIREGAQ